MRRVLAALLTCSALLTAAAAASAQDASAGVRPEAPSADSWRAFAWLRFGQLGSAHLSTWNAELDGIPVHGFALGGRLELALWRHLCAGMELSIGSKSGADLATRTEEMIDFTPIDFGVLAAPRLLLLERRVELRLQLSVGVTSLLFLQGEFPVRGNDESFNRYAFSERPGFGVYGGAGLGIVTWLSARFGAFLELYAVRRHGGATVKPGLSAFSMGEDLPESSVTLDETHFVALFGFGVAGSPR